MACGGKKSGSKKGKVSIWVYNENINKAEVYLNENQFLGSRNFTDFIYG